MYGDAHAGWSLYESPREAAESCRCHRAAALVTVGLADKAAAVQLAAGANAPIQPSEWLVFAIVSGVILAASGAAWLFLRAAAQAQLTESRVAEAMTTLRQELEVAQSIVMAEPQALIAFETGGNAGARQSHARRQAWACRSSCAI